MNLLSAALILLAAAILFIAYAALTLARSIEVFGNQLSKFQTEEERARKDSP